MAERKSNQFSLLLQRRFAPFFLTQFLGAANDNVMKFAFVIMATYQFSLYGLSPTVASALIGGVFIFPFFLFSATSGQLSDKYDKAWMMRHIKNMEILVMAFGAVGFYLGDPTLLLICTFLMGLQSTLFGPVKYAYLPEVLGNRELVGGNAIVESGTFIAILLGQIAGGSFIEIPENGPVIVAVICLVLAVLGRLAVQFVPSQQALNPRLKVNWNPFTETWRNLKFASQTPVLFRSMLGISWMWFLGAAFLSLFPEYAKETLFGHSSVALALLGIFSVGIGVGSLLCEVLSRKQVEVGLVPIGALGITIFCVDLYFASNNITAPINFVEISAYYFFWEGNYWRIILDLGFISMFSGLYSVPMYALIQQRSEPEYRARIIGANNIMNALFMVVSAILVMLLSKAGLTAAQIFLVVGLLNLLVTTYIFSLVPEYFWRLVAWVLTVIVYRFDVRGRDRIPSEGAVILTCNHVSFVDAVLLLAASPRPIYFLMDHRMFQSKVLGTIFRAGKAIPIAPQKEDPVIYEQAFEKAAQVLRDGDILAIFPEGAITRDGLMHEFKGGLMKILNQVHAEGKSVPVVPMALLNLWGSYFSRIDGPGMKTPFRRGVWSRVTLKIDEPIDSDKVDMELLFEKIRAMGVRSVRDEDVVATEKNKPAQ